MLFSFGVFSTLVLLCAADTKQCSSCECVSCDLTSRHHRKSSGIKENPEVDFLQLVVQSGNSFCKSHSCSRVPNMEWTLHGLWPSQRDTMGPCSCNASSPFSLDSVQDMMNKLDRDWPSLTKDSDWFWSHEWCKHGTCAVAAGVSRISDQRSFFSTTLSLFEMHDIAGSLANMGIVPATNTTYPVDKILSAFQMRPKLDCTTYEGMKMLSQIRMCYTTDLQQVDCDDSWFEDRGACSTDDDVYYI